MFPHPGLQHSGFWETLGVQPNMFPLPGLQHSGFWETMGVQSNMFPHPGLQHSGFWETLRVQPNMFPLPGLQHSGFWKQWGYNPTCCLTLAYSIVDSEKHWGYNPICVTVKREPWPLCTGVTSAPVVKAHWALVMALQMLQYGRYRLAKQSPEAFCQWLLPGMWCHTRHTKFPVDGVCGATSLYTSCTSSIKAAATPSRGVLLLLQ